MADYSPRRHPYPAYYFPERRESTRHKQRSRSQRKRRPPPPSEDYWAEEDDRDPYYFHPADLPPPLPGDFLDPLEMAIIMSEFGGPPPTLPPMAPPPPLPHPAALFPRHHHHQGPLIMDDEEFYDAPDPDDENAFVPPFLDPLPPLPVLGVRPKRSRASISRRRKQSLPSPATRLGEEEEEPQPFILPPPPRRSSLRRKNSYQDRKVSSAPGSPVHHAHEPALNPPNEMSSPPMHRPHLRRRSIHVIPPPPPPPPPPPMAAAMGPPAAAAASLQRRHSLYEGSNNDPMMPTGLAPPPMVMGPSRTFPPATSQPDMMGSPSGSNEPVDTSNVLWVPASFFNSPQMAVPPPPPPMMMSMPPVPLTMPMAGPMPQGFPPMMSQQQHHMLPPPGMMGNLGMGAEGHRVVDEMMGGGGGGDEEQHHHHPQAPGGPGSGGMQQQGGPPSSSQEMEPPPATTSAAAAAAAAAEAEMSASRGGGGGPPMPGGPMMMMMMPPPKKSSWLGSLFGPPMNRPPPLPLSMQFDQNSIVPLEDALQQMSITAAGSKSSGRKLSRKLSLRAQQLSSFSELWCYRPAGLGGPPGEEGGGGAGGENVWAPFNPKNQTKLFRAAQGRGPRTVVIDNEERLPGTVFAIPMQMIAYHYPSMFSAPVALDIRCLPAHENRFFIHQDAAAAATPRSGGSIGGGGMASKIFGSMFG